MFYDSVITFLSSKIQIDIFTYIPLKPRDKKDNRFNRFSSLKLENSLKKGIMLESVLVCNKDFSQKGNDLFMRKEIVKDAFEVTCDVRGKNIIIIDDIFSTGSTIFEAIRTLYEAGAKNVIGIVLAVNQLTESMFLKYKNLVCYCGMPMVLRINQNSGKVFFGCKNYLNHENKNTTIDADEGLELLKIENKLEINDLSDLKDEY